MLNGRARVKSDTEGLSVWRFDEGGSRRSDEGGRVKYTEGAVEVVDGRTILICRMSGQSRCQSYHGGRMTEI